MTYTTEQAVQKAIETCRDDGRIAHTWIKLTHEELTTFANAIAQEAIAAKELEADVKVAKGQYQGACDVIKQLEAKLAARGEPVGEIVPADAIDEAAIKFYSGHLPPAGTKLYTHPPLDADVVKELREFGMKVAIESRDGTRTKSLEEIVDEVIGE